MWPCPAEATMGTVTVNQVQCKYLFWKGKGWWQMLPTMICPQAGMQLGLDFRNTQILPKATPQVWTVEDEFTIKEKRPVSLIHSSIYLLDLYPAIFSKVASKGYPVSQDEHATALANVWAYLNQNQNVIAEYKNSRRERLYQQQVKT